MADDSTRLLADARAWIAADPDPATRAELEALIARGDLSELRARFAAPLGFGTAGLRGAMGAGPARMNRAVVARTTAGLCAVLGREVPDAKRRGLCVGHDARHHSAEFADEVAAVAAGAGFAVHVFGAAVPTPLLAFSVLDRGAAAGVMITASHNPAPDNGYKVYWDDGAQILPPHDAAITDIANACSARTLARALPDAARAAGLFRELGVDARERYLCAITPGAPVPGAHALRIAYTALHGVGESFARDALCRAGFTDVYSVGEQAEPDPAFPTAPKPNPEEPGVMSLALALADACGADVVLANDPDADRVAVGARDAHGALRMLTGNEVGALLADHLLAATPDAAHALVIGTIVSTPLVAAIAREHGAASATTLTGFKWIMRRARELERERGAHLVLGFEEALGYAVCPAVRDKDGISAAVAVAALAAAEKARGRTLLDRLHDLWRAHGVHVSGQVTVSVDVARAAALVARMRVAPPTALAGRRVEAVIDLAAGTRHTDGRSEPIDLPRSNVLVWELTGGDRVALRPSGTEPKLKLYLDAREPVGANERTDNAETRARARLGALGEAVAALVRA